MCACARARAKGEVASDSSQGTPNRQGIAWIGLTLWNAPASSDASLSCTAGLLNTVLLITDGVSTKRGFCASSASSASCAFASTSGAAVGGAGSGSGFFLRLNMDENDPRLLGEPLPLATCACVFASRAASKAAFTS